MWLLHFPGCHLYQVFISGSEPICISSFPLIMDPASYKNHVTPRGLKYHYFFNPADPSGLKPTLVFLHGFPSNAHEWRHQVGFFVQRGYGVLAPDLLGYGGTDKPTDVATYAKSLMSADIIAIMDKEGVANTKVYAIGHDWCVPFLFSAHPL